MGSFAPSAASTQASTTDMARGRKQGYQNYGAKEELLLCDLAAKLLPTGRNMWIELAVDYNISKDPSWRERDFDSLRRKFRKLYGKPKPTGNHGDRLTLKQRAILMAHETQFEIEKKGGAHTSHDGHDNGEDDERLMDEVNAALFADEVDKTFNVKSNSVSIKGGGDNNRVRNRNQQEETEEAAAAEEEDDSASSSNSGEDERNSEAETSEEAAASQSRDPPLPPVSELQDGDATLAGAVMTPQGLVPLEFAADFQQCDSHLGDGEESDTAVTLELIGHGVIAVRALPQPLPLNRRQSHRRGPRR